MIGPEMAADHVYFIAKSEVAGFLGSGSLFVAATAFTQHIGWMGGMSYEVDMGTSELGGLIVATVAGNASQGRVDPIKGVRMA